MHVLDYYHRTLNASDNACKISYAIHDTCITLFETHLKFVLGHIKNNGCIWYGKVFLFDRAVPLRLGEKTNINGKFNLDTKQTVGIGLFKHVITIFSPDLFQLERPALYCGLS